MERSKILVIFLMFLLTGCSGVSGEALFDQATISLGLYAQFDEGVIYTENDNENFMYLDYESGKSTEFCAIPSCNHNDANCGGYRGNVLEFFVAGDKFYHVSFATEHRTSGEYIDLYVSDINRQNERLIHSFSGNFLKERIYSGNVVYFLIEEETGEDEELLSYQKGKVKLLGYDLVREEIIGEVELVSGYSQAVIDNYGINDGKIIFKTHRFEEAIEWEFKTKEEADELMEDVIVEYVRVDINTLETVKSESFSKLLEIDVDIENPAFVSNNIVFYNLGGKVYTYDITTKETSLILEKEAYVVEAVEDKVIVYEREDRGNIHLYENGELQQIYMPQNGDMSISSALWHSHEDYIYIASSSVNGSMQGYEQYSPFIIKVNKEDIYKESYEAMIVS